MALQKGPEENQSREPNAPPTKKDEKVGWIEGLAQRSTGLPGSISEKKEISQGKTPWSYAGIGIQFAGTVALFAFMGYFLDRQTGWTPWGTVGLSMLGIIGGLYLLIKVLLKEDLTPPAPPTQGDDMKRPHRDLRDDEGNET